MKCHLISHSINKKKYRVNVRGNDVTTEEPPRETGSKKSHFATAPSLVTSTTILGTTLPHLSHKVRVKMGSGMAQKIFMPKNIKRNA